MATLVTRSGKGSPLTHTEVDANFTNLNTDKLEASDLTQGTGISISGTTITNSAPDQTVSITGSGIVSVSGTYPNFEVAASLAPAEVKTSYESNSNTNAFTDAEQTKLSGIEAGADVTDTTNVTAAGALMDSELANITAVKALDQGVSTTDTVTFEAVHEDYDALSGTTPTIDADLAGSFDLTTSGDTTFTFSSVTSGLTVGFALKVTAGGAHTLTWPASVAWAGGTAPDAPASGETDVYVFYTVNGGTNWYGAIAIDAAA